MSKNQNERAVIDLVINGQQAQTSLKDLTLAVGRARSELIKMKEADNPQLYAEKLEALHKLTNAQKEMAGKINDTTTAWGRFKKEFATLTAGVVGGNVITYALQSLVALIPDTLDHTMKLKDSFADIEKATGLSASGVKNLNKELKAIDTRTTNKELRDIAVAGGQLGVPTEQLKDFVESTDRAVVALGDEFTGGVDEIAKKIGGMAKLFDETKNQNIGKSIDGIGSALNELGAAGSATAPVIADFTLRIGQLGKLAPSITETMGLGAAFQELGFTAEIASSGLSQILMKSSQASALFSQQIGMTTKETEALINKSPNEYLLKLAESFRGMSATQVAQRMKELKIESEESVKVMSLLANQTDLVREKQQLNAKAMAESTSIVNEAAKKNHQLALDLKELNEWFNSLFTSEAVTNFVVSATHSAVEFTKVLPKIGDWLKVVSDNFLLITGAAALYYRANIQATAAVVAHTLAEGYRKVAYEVGYRWMLLQTTATAAYEVATMVLTGQITLQTAVVALARNAWATFSAVLSANPIGAVIAAVSALAYAVKYFSENSERALAVEREKVRINQDLQKVIKATTKEQQAINEKIHDYNNLSKTEQDNLEKTIMLKKTEAVARLSALQAQARENALQNAAVTPWQSMVIGAKNTLTLSLGLGAKRDLLKQEQENMKTAYDQAMAGSEQLKEQIEGYQKEINEINKIKSHPAATGNNSPKTIVDPDKKPKKTEAQKDSDELEKMLADARKDSMSADGDAYNKSVAQFAEKYTKMYGLAKNNTEKINEIQRLSLIEWAGIEEKYTLKQKEEEEKRMGELLKAAEAELELKKKIKENEIAQQVNTGTLTEDDGKAAKLKAEETFLEAKRVLHEAHYQALADLYKNFSEKADKIDRDRKTDQANVDGQITDNQTEQTRARTALNDKEVKHAEELAKAKVKAEKDAHQKKKEIFDDSVTVMKGFFKENTIIYKAALVAQQAWALGEVAISYSTAVMKSIESAAGIPFPANLAAIATSMAIPTLQAAAAVANIRAQKFDMPAFLEGGFTDSENPSGFYSSPTRFMDKKYTVAEDGRPEFVVSNPALQIPMVADFARMLDVAQRSGDYSALTQSLAQSGGSQAVAPSGAPAAGGQTDLLLMQIHAQLRANNQKMDEVASRPIENNYRTFEKYQQRIQEIRQSVSL